MWGEQRAATRSLGERLRLVQRFHCSLHGRKQNLLLLQPYPLAQSVVSKVVVYSLLVSRESRQIAEAAILRDLLCPQFAVCEERVVIHEERLCVRPMCPYVAGDGKAVRVQICPVLHGRLIERLQLGKQIEWVYVS